MYSEYFYLFALPMNNKKCFLLPIFNLRSAAEVNEQLRSKSGDKADLAL